MLLVRKHAYTLFYFQFCGELSVGMNEHNCIINKYSTKRYTHARARISFNFGNKLISVRNEEISLNNQIAPPSLFLYKRKGSTCITPDCRGGQTLGREII